jgi:hypothetical protein
MPAEMIDTPDILTCICGHCGIALYGREVAAEFSGNMIDYEARGTWTGGYVLCGECWERVKVALRMDMEEAVDKRQRLERDDFT